MNVAMASSALTTPGGTAAHDRKDGVLLNGSASLDIGRPCCFKPNCAVPASTSVTAPATVLYCTKRSTCGAILETIALLTCATEFDWADAERSAPLKNVAHLYRLAVEKTGAGVTTYHAVQEEGVSLWHIAEAIGIGLKVPVVSIPYEESVEHFGPFFGQVATMDMSASSEWTRKTLGWNPTGPRMIEDLTNVKYL